MNNTMENLGKENILFIECIESLPGSIILDEKESKKLWNLFKQRIPLVMYGRVDWISIKWHMTIDNPSQIIPMLSQSLGKDFNHIVYIFWNDAYLPVIKAHLTEVINAFDDVACVAPDTWLLDTSISYIIELFHEGEIMMGLLDNIINASD